MRSASKCQQAAQTRHRADLLGEESVARVSLGRRRQVGWWNATDSIGHAAVRQSQPVPWVRSILAVRQAKMQQRAIEQLSGIVTRERSSRPVGAAHARRQTDDQQLVHRGYRNLGPAH